MGHYASDRMATVRRACGVSKSTAARRLQEGAAPILHVGRCLGAIAVSGLTKELDGEFAQAGADALTTILGS